MALPRAVQITTGVVLQVVDYQVVPMQVKADASGTATATYDQIDPLYLWRVERLVVQHNSTNSLTVTVYGGAVGPINIRDWTPVPAGFIGIAEYPTPMTVLGGQQLEVVATGANPGDVLTVSAQYALVQRVPAGSA